MINFYVFPWIPWQAFQFSRTLDGDHLSRAGWD
jgi:hypothetical protein